MLEGFDFAVGIVPGEQAIERYASGIEVLARIRSGAVEGFRCQVTRRTGETVRLVAGQPRAVGQAEVEQAQFAVIAKVEVLRLDVAVQDVAPVQLANCPQQPRCMLLPLVQRHQAVLP
ncbi:hypothetical protein D9M71_73280 [compost metagenome]